MEGKSFPEKDAAQTGFLITALPFASRRRGLPHRSWPLSVGTPDKIPILSDRSAILALCCSYSDATQLPENLLPPHSLKLYPRISSGYFQRDPGGILEHQSFPVARVISSSSG
jgi:hypothetical protein